MSRLKTERATRGLSGAAIKRIALAAMTLDHIGYFGAAAPALRGAAAPLRILGRIAAPLFLFMLLFFFQSCQTSCLNRNITKPNNIAIQVIISILHSITIDANKTFTASDSQNILKSQPVLLQQIGIFFQTHGIVFIKHTRNIGKRRSCTVFEPQHHGQTA